MLVRSSKLVLAMCDSEDDQFKALIMQEIV